MTFTHIRCAVFHKRYCLRVIVVSGVICQKVKIVFLRKLNHYSNLVFVLLLFFFFVTFFSYQFISFQDILHNFEHFDHYSKDQQLAQSIARVLNRCFCYKIFTAISLIRTQWKWHPIHGWL